MFQIDGKNYKKCVKCKVIKPIDEFYSGKGKDGLGCYCKSCARENAKKSRKNGTKPPLSTRDGFDILKSQGVNISTAARFGKKYFDGVAKGCVPIEIKGAHRGKNGHFLFLITPRQRRKLGYEISDGVLMLIFYYEDRKRVLIIPGNDPWLVKKFQEGKRGLSFAPDSIHGNAKNWEEVKHYEDAFRLIEQRRDEIKEKLKNGTPTGA